MHSTSIIISTAAFLAATTVLAAPASEKRSGQTFAVNQLANPKFKSTSGVLAAARAYSKFKKPFPKGLKNAVEKQFPGWGKPAFIPWKYLNYTKVLKERFQQTLAALMRGPMMSTTSSQL